ncbi:photosynthetic NDH subunit of lumenal location 3, chloroplastic-like [Iris pallida]|uniref:Photosynthetic NDH subunit of lumenal location 3, chloroplastic-like n=1 Tax=Iris pallida TaxID=29817 RepID=A0AAX6F071_IRIPA|nr:photosynthetic NDH subunit of lumenal location 3, chloroplastic-like [Iris pallida]
MEDMEWKGSVYRIKKCAFDLLAMEEDLFDNDEDDGNAEDGDGFWWEMMARELSLKSTFLYCDLNRIISGAFEGDRKKALTDLANRLFYFMEELGCAVKRRSISLAQVHYNDAALVLQEVMAALAPRG